MLSVTFAPGIGSALSHYGLYFPFWVAGFVSAGGFLYVLITMEDEQDAKNSNQERLTVNTTTMLQEVSDIKEIIKNRIKLKLSSKGNENIELKDNKVHDEEATISLTKDEEKQIESTANFMGIY